MYNNRSVWILIDRNCWHTHSHTHTPMINAFITFCFFFSFTFNFLYFSFLPSILIFLLRLYFMIIGWRYGSRKDDRQSMVFVLRQKNRSACIKITNALAQQLQQQQQQKPREASEQRLPYSGCFFFFSFIIFFFL